MFGMWLFACATVRETHFSDFKIFANSQIGFFFWITRTFFFHKTIFETKYHFCLFLSTAFRESKKLEASNTSKQFLSDHKFWILQSDRAPTPMTSNSFVYFYFPFVRSAFCKKNIWQLTWYDYQFVVVDRIAHV